MAMVHIAPTVAAMTRTPIPESGSDRASAAVFGRILCAVDGTRSAAEAARQATLLAGPNGALTFIAVTHHAGVGATAMADLSPAHASQALVAAVQAAEMAGVRATTTLAEGRNTGDLILHAARDHDLLILGAPPHGRAAGIALGSTASAAVHRSPVPVMLARPPGQNEFPKRIVVASDGSPESTSVVDIAARIARRHQAKVTLVHTGRRETLDTTYRIAEEATELYEQLRVEAIVVTDETPAHDTIVKAADRETASLVITGSRGRTGLAALGSVSERVAHAASCSVLILRPRDRDAR